MSLSTKKNSPKILSERLFFHDIINLTHGILLFLSNKRASKKSIEMDEIATLEKEIKTLQLMLKDHYQMKHKNLEDTSEWLPLKDIKPAINGLLETYLGQKNIPYQFNVVNESVNQLICLPVFYRILNNLIKNMSEARSTQVQIDLVFEKGRLLIETRNRVLSDLSDSKARSLEGLGLESIRLLSLEHGGSFSHEMVNNLWCNHLTLPLRSEDTMTLNRFQKKVA